MVVVQPGVDYGPGDTAQTGDLIAQVVRGGRPPVKAQRDLGWRPRPLEQGLRETVEALLNG